MAKMTLYTDNFQSTPYVLPCYDLDFMASFQNPLYSGFQLFYYYGKTLSHFYDAIVFRGKASFSVVGDDKAERYDLIKNLPTPFLQPIQWQRASEDFAYYQPKDGTYSVITSKPNDWDDICKTHIATRLQNNGAIDFSSYTDWDALSEFAAQGHRDILRFNYPLSRKFLVTGGLTEFSFGIYNGFDPQVPSSKYMNFLHSGISYHIPMSNLNYGVGAYGYGNACSFTNLSGGAIIIPYGSAADVIPGNDTSVTYCNSYPVAFMIPKGTPINGNTLTKDTSFYGVMSVAFNSIGLPETFVVQALSSEMWNIQSGAGNSAGSDTQPTGGHGKQQKGGYNPQKSITKNTNGGLLLNPTTSAGFVIYQFTPAEFTDFLSKVYTETALPGIDGAWSGILNEVSINGSGITKTLLNTGWSNTENIVFVKTSPVNFPTQIYNLSKLSIGALGIGSISARVVQSYIVDGTEALGSIGSDPEWFTDVEPYASASIFFPLAGSVAVPPSVLAGSSCSLRYAFNLLNNGSGYSMHIVKDGNYLHLAKNGECAKSADCVIPGRDISGTVSSLGALAATGIATLATGGTAAPSLVTTALGAATTAVHEATDLSISNMPPCSSGSPYDDTVNGGLRDIVLYRTKAERFTSGEGSTNSRAGVMGTFSYEYISNLSDLKEGSFVSVLDVKVEETSGMTKAEHDKIVALLKEGVYM
jgi:hypothetical protein